MDSAEYTRWIAFDQLSPIGGERWDFLIASLGFWVRSIFARVKFADFMPHWGKSKYDSLKRGSDKESLLAWASAVKKRQESKRGNHCS